MTRGQLLPLAQANGFTGVTPDLFWALVLELLYLNSGTSMTKAQLLASAQANGFTGVEPTMRDALILELLSLGGGGGGGGGGSIGASGDNYCFSGVAPNQELKILNLDTGLANRIDTTGADGVQAIELQDGSGC